MMSTAPPLSLTRDQASRLQAYMQTYRRYAFASLVPSAGRNTLLRVLQAIQGKLVAIIDQRTIPFTLILTTEELTTLKTILVELLHLYAQEAPSAERNAALADIAALKASIERSQ